MKLDWSKTVFKFLFSANDAKKKAVSMRSDGLLHDAQKSGRSGSFSDNKFERDRASAIATGSVTRRAAHIGAPSITNTLNWSRLPEKKKISKMNPIVELSALFSV